MIGERARLDAIARLLATRSHRRGFFAGLIAILLSVIPVYIASRLSQGEVAGRI